jgi:hypothetical protein
MHGAWCVGLIAGDNYVAVGSQRVAQGEIDNFDLRFRINFEVMWRYPWSSQ